MIATPDSQESSWLQKFFSGRNQLNWESIETQAAPVRVLAQVTPWLKKLTLSGYKGTLVLPLYEPDGRVTWYAMAGDDRCFAQMIEEITGFVGPSYSDFRGEWASLDMDDAPERALAERYGPRVIKFSAAQASDQPHIESALTLYLSVLARRPAMPDRTQRPFGKIRGDFDRALLAGNASGAQSLLEELLASGRVNAEQRKCLEIRLLAGLGRGESLAKNTALIASVSDLSLPTQTVVDVVAALYDTFVIPIESGDELPTIIDTFKRHILRPFGGLFRERKGIRHPKVLRAFLLSELAGTEPNALRCQSLLAAYPEKAEGYEIALAWCKVPIERASKADADPKEAWLRQAIQAIADEDYSTASTRCFELLPLPWAYSALLRCAVEIGATDVRQRVLKVFEAAPETLIAALTDKDRSRLHKLQGLVPTTRAATKSGWVAWAGNVIANPLLAPSVVELQEMAAKWSLDDYANDAPQCEALAHRLAEASGDAQDIFRDAFPVLVDFFESSFGARRAFSPIYSMLIKFLGWSGSLSSDELEIGVQLIQALLATGPSEEAYSDAVGDLQEILKANASPAHFDWGLNLAELLSQYPAPDKGAARLGLFSNVIGTMQVAPHRVTVAQRDVLTTLARDYHCSGLLDAFPAADTAPTASSNVGVSYSGLIGIYTLTEGAGQRAREILERMFPKATVELNNDTVSTNRLVALAKNADIFVFAWKSSKHQAYFSVKEAREGQDIILPTGKGTASILSGVLNEISRIVMH